MKRYKVLISHDWDLITRDVGEILPGSLYDKSPARIELIDTGVIEVYREPPVMEEPEDYFNDDGILDAG